MSSEPKFSLALSATARSKCIQCGEGLPKGAIKVGVRFPRAKTKGHLKAVWAHTDCYIPFVKSSVGTVAAVEGFSLLTSEMQGKLKGLWQKVAARQLESTGYRGKRKVTQSAGEPPAKKVKIAAVAASPASTTESTSGRPPAETKSAPAGGVPEEKQSSMAPPLTPAAVPKQGWVVGITDPIEKHYTLGKRLGEPGAYGYAQLATSIATGKQYAAKVISKRGMSENSLDSIRSEIGHLKTLNHPGILKGFDAFETVSTLYIITEFCGGGELFDRISARKRFTEKDAQLVLHQLMEALDYLHKRNIAHCDLKPDNFLFLGREEESPIKIIDFGMSKYFKRGEKSDLTQGTLFYMAPEVIRGKYTWHCDIWSMGVVMFVMLFGYPPFHGRDSTITDKIQKGFNPKVKEGFGPWFPVKYQVSESARDLLSQMLNMSPTDRLSASEVLQHPWMTGKDAKDYPLEGIVDRISNLSRNTKLKTALLKSLGGSKFSESELEVLQKIFEAVDADGDGVITQAELKEAVEKNGSNVDTQMAAQLITLADADGDGQLSYDELLMAAVHRKLVAKEDRLWETFCSLDKNMDGKLSIEEISQGLSDGDADIAKQMISEVDQDGDGLVDYQEFLAMWSTSEEVKRTGSFRTNSLRRKSSIHVPSLRA